MSDISATLAEFNMAGRSWTVSSVGADGFKVTAKTNAPSYAPTASPSDPLTTDDAGGVINNADTFELIKQIAEDTFKTQRILDGKKCSCTCQYDPPSNKPETVDGEKTVTVRNDESSEAAEDEFGKSTTDDLNKETVEEPIHGEETVETGTESGSLRGT